MRTGAFLKSQKCLLRLCDFSKSQVNKNKQSGSIMVPQYVNHMWELLMFAAGIVSAWAVIKGMSDD